MNKVKSFLMKLGPLLALIILSIILSFASDNFLTVNNMMNILRQTAVNSLIASGMLIVLITAGIDLSVGANAILATTVMGAMMTRVGIGNPYVLIIVGILTGTLVGFANGVLLTRLELPHPFVSTLGMKNILSGLALLVVATKTIGNFPEEVMVLGSANVFKFGKFSGFPLSFIVVLLIFVLFHLMLNRTAFGRKIYMVGGNGEAARLSGINSKNILTLVYTISGFMTSLAGIVIIGRTGTANPASAVYPYDTDAIAACIIGGASFSGGKGTIWGTLIGALLITVIRNGLTLLSAQSDVQYVVIGAVIIVAVYIDVVRNKAEAKARRLAAN